MNRRRLLESAGASVVALSGCLDTTSIASSGRTLATVSHVRTATDGLDLSVTLDRRGITTKRTAVVTLAFSNPSSETVKVPSVNLRKSKESLYSQEYDRDGNVDVTGLALVPKDRTDEIRRDPDAKPCWRPTSFPGGSLDIEDTELAPNESASATYEVWDMPRVEGCLESGTYRFGYWIDQLPNWKVTLELMRED